MPQPQHMYQQFLIENLIYDAVIPFPDPINVVFTLQLLDIVRSRVISKRS